MKRLSPDLDREIRRLAAKGHSLREIVRLVERSRHAVTNVLARPAADPEDWNRSPARLSLAEREEIRAGLERGDTFTAIAAKFNRAVSTVSRDVAANGGVPAIRRGGLTNKPAGRRNDPRRRSWPVPGCWPT